MPIKKIKIKCPHCGESEYPEYIHTCPHCDRQGCEGDVCIMASGKNSRCIDCEYKRLQEL